MVENIFEEIKQINEFGQEFWSARKLMPLLGYSEWRNFLTAIDRAKESCLQSNQPVVDHFVDANEMIIIALGTAKEAQREIQNFSLSRYACYLIAQNGDPRKEEVARAQTYFAIQTRRQETSDLLVEDSKRVMLREEMKTHNKNLVSVAKDAGVRNFANFQDFGYMGLYGNLRQKQIHERKKLKPKDSILDHMGSEELAANLFRATQAEAKLKREQILGETKANRAHYEVGKKVRQTISELGGTMPEQLKTPDNIKESRKRIKKSTKTLGKN